MNPISVVWRQIKSIFQFFYEDVKEDWNTLKEVAKRSKAGKSILSPSSRLELDRYLRNFTIGGFLKDNWMLILFCCLCYVSGWWLASQYYQTQVNNAIVDALKEAALSGRYDVTKLNVSIFNITK